MSDPFDDPDLRACADLVARGDPERLTAIMAAPVPARVVLFPLYAFNLEVGRAPWLTSEPMIAEMRLQWWRDVLDEIAQGGLVRRHEVVTPLAHVLDAAGAARLDALIEARRWDIYRDPHEDEAALCRYLEDTGGALMETAARALGDPDGVVARDLGYATALAGYLRAVPELEARGRVPLVDGRPEGVQALARDGLARLAKARAARGAVPVGARPALVGGALTGAILERALADPRRVAEGSLMPPEAQVRLRRLWVGMTGRW